MLQFGFGESQFLKFGDFGAFKERLRSVAIEEIGQAGEGLPRVNVGGFAPWFEILRGEWRLAYLALTGLLQLAAFSCRTIKSWSGFAVDF